MSISIAAISLLQDVIATIYCPGTGDTGVPVSSWGSGLAVNVDKVSTKKSGNFVDHSGGQSANPVMRGTKYGADLTIEAKLLVGYGAIYTAMDIGIQAKVVLVGTIGANTVTDTFAGIITEIDKEWAGPSTVKFTLKPYGSQLTQAYT